MNILIDIAEQFTLKGRPCDFRPFGSGNINPTFLLTTDAEEQIILQQLNPAVFQFPDRVMQNLSLINRHMAAELTRQELDRAGWQLPEIIRTRDGRDYHIAPDGTCWRAVQFISRTISIDAIETLQQAKKAGMAIGRFHRLTANLDPSRLHDTLPGFHETPRYLEHYDRINKELKHESGEAVDYCKTIINSHRRSASILEDARKAGDIQVRVMHGDPKVSNILFDETSGDAVALVDLDTAKPGLILHDIGDFFRSACNPAGEESDAPDTVVFDLKRFETGLAGYLSEMKDQMTDNDKAYILESIRLMTFELGIRFFTDYLEGNVYFKTSHKTRNLKRAVVQLKLFESILSQEQGMRDIVKSIVSTQYECRRGKFDPKHA